MKRQFLLYISLLALIFSACSKQAPSTGEEETALDTIPLIVTKVKQCSKLYTSEYKVHKIITHDDQLKLQGSFLQKHFNFSLPMTSRKIAIPMDATLKAYIDFSDFSERNVSRFGDRIEILLPDPKVELTDSRIDHEEIKRYVSFMRSNFSDAEMTEYENRGRAAILNSIPQLGIIDVAMENASHTLVPMLRQMGYDEENITITFRKTFTPSDLQKLLDIDK